jgi:hypothetical protein
MTAIIHGLISGIIWSAILGSCMIAIAAVVTAVGTSNERVRSEAAGTTRSFEISQSRRSAVTPTLAVRRPAARSASVVASRIGQETVPTGVETQSWWDQAVEAA